MDKFNKISITVVLFIAYYSLFPAPVSAVCPVCTVAVAGGLGLSRYLGVDDTISGIWIGGLILSSSLWLIDLLSNKDYFKYLKKPRVILFAKYLIIVLMYLLIFVPLAWKDIIGHPFNTFWGVDKLIVGTIVGTLVFLTGMWTDKKVRRIKGRQLINYQKVVFPIALLTISSIMFWIMTRR